ncbi:hypothetical protein CWI37_0801p0020 [Hamiltosporidium tvaerminnensis]|uniref:Uncharacterized protein n=1 Tax=Hamiltosporidium tvaerminnensis TaxID=1176355 RepID=A0A4Q9L189_9MICR|nr:hypothetical protein CWI37_0801p0020 [Hamiltosporidium tvaerminnensis]
MDFFNNDIVEIISNENDEEALSYAFAKLPACKLDKSPEIDEKGTLWARGLIERMRKIKDKLQDVLRSLNILAKDVKEEFAPGYQKNTPYDI